MPTNKHIHTDSKVVELILDHKFKAFLDSVRKQHPLPKGAVDPLSNPLMALDPGETTGVAEFDGEHTIRVYQKITKDIGQSYDWLLSVLKGEGGLSPYFCPDHLRYEDYRVYQWKTDDHAWSPVHTIRWIGAIQVAAHVTSMPNSCIMASHAKAFWNDQNLTMLGLYPKGLRHGKDALRHLLYYLCFPYKAV